MRKGAINTYILQALPTSLFTSSLFFRVREERYKHVEARQDQLPNCRGLRCDAR
jgi:hypothetical protein